MVNLTAFLSSESSFGQLLNLRGTLEFIKACSGGFTIFIFMNEDTEAQRN